MGLDFDEKSGIVACETSWGRWWQTVAEVHIDVKLPEGTRAKSIKVDTTPSTIACSVQGTTTFKVSLHNRKI